MKKALMCIAIFITMLGISLMDSEGVIGIVSTVMTACGMISAVLIGKAGGTDGF